MSDFVICKQVVKAYRVADHEIVALRGIDFEMRRGEMVAIVGPSGSGKSSLLNLLGGLDTPTAGKLIVDDEDLLALNQRQLARYRLHQVGFLWQRVDRNLLSHRSAVRNVTLPMTLAGLRPRERTRRARALLEAVGLGDYMHQHPAALSGGQQQRVGMAVALANEPPLLLADEPTGALDADSSQQVMDLLHVLRERFNLTVLLTTHDLDIASHADRVLTLRDGALGQDIAGDDASDHLRLDEAGRIALPDVARGQFAGDARIAVEIRPEGVLLRPEEDDDTITADSFAGMLPQDTPPEPERGFWGRLFRRGKQQEQDE